MKRKSLIAALALIVLPACTASAATTFSFEELNSGFNFGTFIAPFDLSPGTYNLSSLGNFSVEFSLDPDLVFSTMDIVTPLDQVAVKITPFAPGVERLVFVPTCCDDGIYTALQLRNAAQWGLLFAATPDGESSFFEPLGAEPEGFPDYLALSPIVPEPSTWAMMLLGFAGLGFAGYRALRMSVKVAAR